MRKSNGKWYVRFVVDGVEYSQPTGLSATERNRRKAMEMESAAKLLVIQGKSHLLKLKSIPFNDAAAQFLSWAEGEYSGESRNSFLRIRSSFGSLKHFFGRAIVSSITEGHLEDFKSERRKRGIRDVSIRHDLHNLSLFFQYCQKKRWVRENVVRRVAIPSDAEAIRMNVLTAEQEETYFSDCLWMAKAASFIASPARDSYRDLYEFGRLMIGQGTRPEELLELRKDAVDLLNRWLFIRSGKTRAARRRLKLTVESRAILSRRLQSQPGPFVFPSPLDPQSHRGPTWRVHGEVLTVHGLSFVPYDLRHTFATRAAADGMPVPVLAAVLGHANLRSVMKYVHISSENIDAETDRIESMRAAKIRQTKPGLFPGGTFGRDSKGIQE